MKKAFTMIELIFVIVIIGILAAVAIPKLSATRDDAVVSIMISDAKIAVSNIGDFIATVGTNNMGGTKLSAVTNVDFSGVGCADLDESTTDLSPSVLTLCDQDIVPPVSCIEIRVSDNGQVQVINTTGPSNSTCQTVSNDPAIISLAGIADDPDGKVYRFAGQLISR